MYSKVCPRLRRFTRRVDRNRGRGPPFRRPASRSDFSRRLGIRLYDRQPLPDRGPRRNEQIRISPIRLIGTEGEQLGLIPTVQALAMAREAGLDLVEVAPDERPPVCRILDYGKVRFANSQKGNKTGKVRQQKLKEIRVRPKTGDHDLETKVAQARKFLEHNDKVQVTVMFRGREMQHQEEGRRVLDAVLEGLTEVGKVERPPTMDGKKMTALIMPNKAAVKAKTKPAAAKPVVAALAKPTV
ncbi:MAG TPA: translation initiation factor IF-3 [Gemmataceae bacterium]|nr:translation initiation factor IF-3 [Gemmataceae bacterium]